MKRRKRWQGRLLLVVAACAAPVADAGAALDAARAAAAAKKGSAKKGPSAADRARAAQARATGAKPAKADAPRATPAAKADAPRTATPAYRRSCPTALSNFGSRPESCKLRSKKRVSRSPSF